ncbi:MAG: hypothetical protein ACRCUP_02115 [Mycoplasmatales bacterium]
MKKTLILNELDHMILEGKPVSFRKLTTRLNISASTINYYFKNQENLYFEYLHAKINKLLLDARPQNFTELLILLGNQFYFFSISLNNELTLSFLISFQEAMFVEKSMYVEKLYNNEFGFVDLAKITYTISAIITSMISAANISKFLSIDLSIEENRKNYLQQLITTINKEG